MNGETRRVLREDGCLVILALIAVMLATCARCQETRPPEHWTRLPTVEEFLAVQGEGHVVAMSAETWSAVLDRLEIAEATEAERDAAQRALAATREALALVQAERAQDREDEATIADGDRALLRCESVKRGWMLVSFGLGGYALAKELD